MAHTGWRGWLNGLTRTLGGKRRRRAAGLVPAGRKPVWRRRLELERLEDRLAPATNITVVAGAAGAGNLDHFLSAANGTITTADDPGDTAATLSVGALQSVGAGTTISITADATIHFNDIGALALQTGTGVHASFTTNTGTLDFANVFNTVSTGGGSLSFSAGTDLTVANLNTGTGGGDVSLTAGTTGPAGAGGNLQFENISTNGSGNLTFGATGGMSNTGTITQSGSSTASGMAINATATGNIAVNSLRGTTVNLTSSTGSVTSTGTEAVQASAELIVGAATGINLFTLAASLEADNSTSGNITFTQLASPAQTLTITGSGVVNSAPQGAITIDNLGSSITVAGGSTVQSAIGANTAVTLLATDFQLNGTVNSGVGPTILGNSTAGRQIDLGTNTPGEIGLTQSELNNVTAGVLQIGTSTAGAINVSAAITNPASWNTLALVNGSNTTEAAAGSLTVPNLRVSSAGPVTLNSVNNVQNLAGSVSGSGNGFSINNGTNTLTIANAGVDGVLGLTTNNGNIDLKADNIRIFQVVTPGTGTVVLEPFTQTLNITVGTASVPATTFGITNGGLGWITSGVTQVGVGADTGTITITNTINRTPTSTAPSRSQTLDLVTGNTTANAVTQTAALSVANLAVQAVGDVTLTNSGNAVDKLAAAVTGTGDNIEFTDSTGFNISTVAGVAGISASTSSAADLVVLTAGGSVTQDNGSNITSPRLLLLGTGGYTLTNSGNDVGTLAANVTNAVSYTDANDLIVGTITNPTTLTPTIGVTTNGADIAITASASTSGTALTVGQAIDTTSTANITLTADQMSLAAAVKAHAGIVTLQPTTAGRAITLGTTVSGTLSLLQTDLANVTAGVLRIGNLSSSGSITVTAPINDAGLGWSTLSLLTELGAGISQNAGATLTVANLQAAGNTGVSLNANNVVSKLAGATESGAFSFVDSTSLTVDNVDSGLGGGFGSGIITQAQGVVLKVNVLNDSLTVNQTIDTTHSFGAPAGGGADMILTADNMALNNNSPSSTINAGTGGVLTLRPFTASNTIAVGGPDAAGQLGIDDNDLSNVTASVVRIGSSAQTGAITVDGTINTHAGFNTLTLFALGSGGAITQTTGSIAVANLALQAIAGIGSAGAIQVVGPINLAFNNVTSGNVAITSTGAMTITTVDIVDGSPLSKVANLASGGTVTLQADSPMTFAVNTSSSGTYSATTTETASENVTQLPPPDDDLTVNANVTVHSNSGDVTFTSGDSIVTGSGSTLSSGTGSVKLTAGSGDVDNDATLQLNGSISASVDIDLSSPGDVCVSPMSAGGAVRITSTNGAILDCDTGETEPTNPTDDFTNGASVDITAGTLILSASTGIGIVSGDGVGPLETQVGTLAAETATGGVFITNGVTSVITLNVGDNGPSPTIQGVQVTGASGDIQLINQGSINIKTANDVVLGPGNVTIQAFGAAADIQTGGFNVMGSTGAGNISLTAGRDVLLGDSASFGSFGTNTGAVTIHAGRDFIVTSASAVSVNSGSADITATAGRNISILTGGNDSARITNGGTGQIFLTTGSGGAFTLDSGNGGVVSTAGGNIAISADSMSFSSPLVAITTGSSTAGIVTLEPVTVGQPIDIGGAGSGTRLSLTQADLNEITTGILRIRSTIGSNGSDSITVTAPITDVTTGWTVLSLIAAPLGTVTQTAGSTLTVTDLQAAGLGGVTLTENNAVSTLAGASTTTFSFTDTTSLDVNNVDSTLGIGFGIGIIGGGPVTLTVDTAGDSLTVDQHIDTTHFGGHGANVTLTADAITLNAAVNGGTAGRVSLLPFSNGQLINLGGANAAGTLGLTNTELQEVTAATLQVGDSTAGNITVSNAITLTNVTTLDLETGGGVTQSSVLLTVLNLVVRAVNAVDMGTNGASVLSGSLAADVTGAGQGFTIVTFSDLNVGTVDGLIGVTTNGGAIFMRAHGNMTVNQNVSAGAASIQLIVGNIPNPLFTNNAVISNSGGHAITLSSAGNLVLATGSVVDAAGSGAVSLQVGQGGAGSNDLIEGAVQGGSPTVTGGNGTNALTIDFFHGAALPNGLTFNGGSSGHDTLTVTDAGDTTNAHTDAITGASLVRDGAPAIGYTGVASVTATGGSKDDTFNVTASATVAITVNGGPPPGGSAAIPPGDTLNLNAGGQTVTDNGSVLQVDSDKPINYTSIETLNVTNAAGPVTVTGTGTLVVTVTGSGTGTYQLNGGPVVSFAGGITFNGAGTSTIVVNAQGRPIGTRPGQLTVNGVPEVSYTGVPHISLGSAAGVDAAVGPDVADRATAFNGLTANERFVQAVYLDDLGRAGSKAELDSWAVLFGGPGPNAQTQTQIATGIEHSQEGRDYLVKSWYQTFLGRSANGSEEQGWVNLLLQGQTEEQVLSMILASTEFGTRAQTLTGSSNASQAFVQALYLLLLNRTGGSSEVSFWVGALPTLGRQGVALGFLQTSEFRTDQFEGYYNALLHRPDDPNGLNSWVMTNLGIDAVRIDFEATTEFFANG